MKVKHLVLDTDVHEALKSLKQERGTTLKDFGNTALRAALGLPDEEEMIIENLISTGKIARRDYERAVAEVDAMVRQTHLRIARETDPLPDQPAVHAGSLEGKLLYLHPDRLLAAHEFWAKDAKKTASSVHIHKEGIGVMVVLAGKLLLHLGNEERLLGPNEWAVIPAGVPHWTIALSKTTHLVTMRCPAAFPAAPPPAAKNPKPTQKKPETKTKPATKKRSRTGAARRP